MVMEISETAEDLTSNNGNLSFRDPLRPFLIMRHLPQTQPVKEVRTNEHLHHRCHDQVVRRSCLIDNKFNKTYNVGVAQRCRNTRHVQIAEAPWHELSQNLHCNKLRPRAVPARGQEHLAKTPPPQALQELIPRLDTGRHNELASDTRRQRSVDALEHTQRQRGVCSVSRRTCPLGPRAGRWVHVHRRRGVQANHLLQLLVEATSLAGGAIGSWLDVGAHLTRPKEPCTEVQNREILQGTRLPDRQIFWTPARGPHQSRRPAWLNLV
mmetsp:Transcript_31913/g.71565  ORF Transcript_31913/g.71565 Transcript_31913/m.71565 type:complete len:267 (+) Transcript_31913:608-1408(+)